MDKTLTATLVIAGLVVILALMAFSWYRRIRRQSNLPALHAVPADLGATLGQFTGLYLASTPTGDRLNRIGVRGLGFRERGTVTVTSAGFVLLGDKFIPASDVTGVARASWTIDRGVEPDGLSVISWRLGDTDLDSYFRLDDPQAFDAATTQFPTTTGHQ